MKQKLIQWFAIASSAISVAGNTVYVSPTGTHQFPFNSVSTAATNIQSAIDATSAGDIVEVLPGCYVLSSQIDVSEAIEIVAQTKGSVVVDGHGVVRCFNLDDVACSLDGLVISNGFLSVGEGAGVYCPGYSAVLTNCVVVDCSAPAGGGISGTTAYNCEIRANHAVDYGGGAETAILHSCQIFNNTVVNEGGGIDFSTAYNCLIYSNSVTGSDYGGGGVSYESILVNCTVVDNFSNGSGGGIEGVGAIVLNSIVANNSANGSGMNYIGSINFTNSCCPDITHGVTGNITNAPAFVDEVNGNYHLLMNSPCINAGNNAYVGNSSDLDGQLRISGVVVDMGAYEYQFSDTDGDGMFDFQEAIAGTNPNDKHSFFSITNWSGGSFFIEWPAFSNRQYQVYRAESLTNSFNPVGAVIYYPQNSFTDSVLNASGFYKVEVQLQ